MLSASSRIIRLAFWLAVLFATLRLRNRDKKSLTVNTDVLFCRTEDICLKTELNVVKRDLRCLHMHIQIHSFKWTPAVPKFGPECILTCKPTNQCLLGDVLPVSSLSSAPHWWIHSPCSRPLHFSPTGMPNWTRSGIIPAHILPIYSWWKSSFLVASRHRAVAAVSLCLS